MKKINFILIFAVILIFSAFSPRSSTSVYNVEMFINSMVVGDINNDSMIDVAVGEYNGGIAFLMNNNNGEFTVGNKGLIPKLKRLCYAVNLDDNPTQDVVYIYNHVASDMEIGILYNYNNDSLDCFSLKNHPSADHFDMVYGDIDGNGKKDILAVCYKHQLFYVYYNYGNKNFSEMQTVPVTGLNPIAIRCADLNNDGVDDVVVGGESMEVYFSKGNHTFNYIKIDSLHLKDKLELYDFNNDGLIDIVTDYYSFHNGDSLSFFKNNGDETFTKITKKIETPISSFYVINDYNQDGLYDIAYLYAGRGIEILYNLGDFNFSKPHFVPASDLMPLEPFEYDNTCHSADFDNNDYPDFVYANSLTSIKFLFNDGNGNFVDNPVSNTVQNKQQNRYMQCYPNPFVHSISFKFQLDKPSDVNLTIYDINGKPVARLIDKALTSREVNLNAGNLVNLLAGVYFAVLKIKGKPIEVKKIVKTESK